MRSPALLVTALVLLGPYAQAETKSARIVLVGSGKGGHGPRQHEFAAGVRLLGELLAQNAGASPAVFPDGWPADPDALAGARSLVLYMTGDNNHPFVNPAQ